MKNRIIMGSAISAIVIMILCCIGGGLDSGKRPVQIPVRVTQIKTETPLSMAQKMAGTFSNLRNKKISVIYDNYDNYKIKNDNIDINGNGMNYKFTFEDGSTATIYCVFNENEGSYIIKVIN